MMEKAAVGRPRPMRSRWIATAALALFVVLLLIGGKAGAPYLFQGATLQSELATQVRLTTGLVVTARDHGRFDLLPRPHIVMKGLHFADPTGALTVEADALEGDVRLLPLLVGRIELEAATLVRPRLAVDFDGQPLQPDSTIGRTMRPGTRTGPAPSGRLGVVTLVDGTVSVKSRVLRSMTEFHDVDVTIDWPDIDSPATLTGSFTVHDVAADVAIWLAQPSSLMRGETSPLALRVKSTPLDLSANGDLAVAGSTTFRGHVAMRAPSLGGILALAGTRMPLPAPFSDLALNSDVGIEIDRDGRPAVDLSSLRLHLDGNDYEGALALQDSATPTIAGTLATDQLAVAPFIDRMPRLLDARRQWSRDPLDVARIDPIALDLRISASHLRLAPFTIDDAALAIMTRGDRTEIVLADGKAYGGDVRARASVGIAGDALSLRGMGTLAGADAATLSWDALGRQVATGSLSGSASFDAMGPSPAALIEHLNGSIDARVNGGDFSLLDLGRGLRASDARRLESAMPSMGSARAPFRDLSFGLRLVDGSATLEDAVLHGTALTMKATGAVDLPARELHVAVAASPAGETGEGAGKPLRIELGGSLDKILVTIPPERAGH